MQPIPAAAIRVGLGTAGATAAGLAIFGRAGLDPSDPAFDCLAVGSLLAALVALVRAGRPGPALVLTLVFGALRSGLATERGLRATAAALLLSLGVLLVAIMFDLLARDGLRVGKCLVTGPLLGGVYLALGPLGQLGDPLLAAADALLFQLFIGLVIGDGVGLGVELGELIPGVNAATDRAGRTGGVIEDARAAGAPVYDEATPPGLALPRSEGVEER